MPSITLAQKTLEREKENLLKKDNVVGVGIGKKKKNSEDLDDSYCIVVFVEEKVPEQQLSSKNLVPKQVDSVRTDVVQTGKIESLHKRRRNTLIGGISIGHKDITSGTLGAIVKDRSNEKKGKLLLSNNHVIANNNKGKEGDSILQPGPADGGRSVVAWLYKYIPIKFSGRNRGLCSFSSLLANTFNMISKTFKRNARFYVEEEHSTKNLVDAAVAVPAPNVSVDTLMLGRRKAPLHIREPMPGDKVVKSGRTTGVTEGVVDYVSVEVEVDFGPDGVARFGDQIMLSRMSEPGDSGSVIVREDPDGPSAVGLLFAGSDTVTIANRMTNVKDLLEISF